MSRDGQQQQLCFDQTNLQSCMRGFGGATSAFSAPSVIAMACVLLAASRTRSASGAVEVETSVVSDGIFGWSASVGLLFDDFMCDVVNPLLRPEERFSECGGTFALNPTGIGYAEEQFVPGTRTVETERRAESTKSGFVWEEVSLIEGEQVSSNANTGAASNDKEENELSPSVQHQHHNQQEDKDDPQAESQPRYDESNYYDQTDENEQEQKQEGEPENDEPLEIIWQTL